MDLYDIENKIKTILQDPDKPRVEIQRELELLNSRRIDNAAFYTDSSLVSDIVSSLPSFDSKSELNILEPSVGIGAFLWEISKYYSDRKIHFTLVDIDGESLSILKKLLKKFPIQNADFEYHETDFFDFELLSNKFDLIIGNPPFGNGKKSASSFVSKNLATMFLEKMLGAKSYISLVLPKSVLSAPSFSDFRKRLEYYNIKQITDFGEKGFKGVKIETINLLISNQMQVNNKKVCVNSWVTGTKRQVARDYIMSESFPYWLIYRDDFFDEIAKKLEFNMFDVFRDRQITKKEISENKGNSIQVLRSRNFPDSQERKIISVPGYDRFIEKANIDRFHVAKYMNHDVYLMPNLSYKPRSIKIPKNCIVDGSLALLIPKQKLPTEAQLSYFSSDEFRKFYKVARNYGTRSLNIDKLSVFFLGFLKTSE